MNKKQTAAVYRIALSAVVVAVYFAVMLLTAEFSFGIYQIRIATALYALSMPFPFLVLPLGIANCLSNILGGMAWDIGGGFLAGLLTAGICAAFGKVPLGRWKALLVIPAIELIPALSVPLWLAPTLGVPYWTLAASLLVGQIIPAFAGAFLVFLLEKRAKLLNLKVFGMRTTKKEGSDPKGRKAAESQPSAANDGSCATVTDGENENKQQNLNETEEKQ